MQSKLNFVALQYKKQHQIQLCGHQRATLTLRLDLSIYQFAFCVLSDQSTETTATMRISVTDLMAVAAILASIKSSSRVSGFSNATVPFSASAPATVTHDTVVIDKIESFRS